MSKALAAGLTALFVTMSSFAFAQGARERVSAADLNALTDARIADHQIHAAADT